MKTNTGVRIHLGAMSQALNQSGARPPRGRTTAEPSSPFAASASDRIALRDFGRERAARGAATR